MADRENSDLLGCAPGTIPTSTSARTTTARCSSRAVSTADTMPERRASEQLWREEYTEEGAHPREAVYMDISAGTPVVRNKRLSMPPERPSTLPSDSPTRWPSHKPQFKILLPPANPIPGMSNDTFFDRSLSLNSFPVLTPPEEVFQPSWGFATAAHHEANIELTPPLDAAPYQPEFMSSEPSIPEAELDYVEVSAMDRRNVLATSIQLAVEKFVTRSGSPRTIRAVHQLVPSPTNEDSEATPVSILRPLLDQLQSQDSGNSDWVLVTHAIPEKYPMKNITGSPATTPRALMDGSSGQDYFSVQRIIHNAIVLNDRHDPTSSHSITSPQSPALASTPCSIDISLYQRIIPPVTSQEVRDIFQAGAPSALADRLIELLPSGRLVFVYPTAAGARTFAKDYLDKALAPVTRSIVFGKGLPSEACSAIASSSAVGALPDFETMKDQVAALLHGMAAAEGHQSRSTWSILSSGTQEVTLPDKTWKQWWTLQETPRIRAVMDHYFRQVSRQHGFYRDERFTANELARQLADDLCQRAEDGTIPPPIEVAVFVIERNS